MSWDQGRCVCRGRGQGGVGTVLEPIVQASQLLQARKTEADVESIFDMCSKLTISWCFVVWGRLGMF